MNNDDKINQIIHEVFEETNMKITKEDPIVIFNIFLSKMLNEHLEKHQENLKKMEDNLHLFFEENIKFSESERNAINTSFKNHVQEIDESLFGVLNDFDEKTKDLNLVLTKVNARYDEELDRRFNHFFDKVQSKQDNSFSKREMLLVVGSLIIGFIISAIIFKLI